MTRFRMATRQDVPGVVALLSDDMLGQARENADPSPYLAAFDRMLEDGNNHLIVGVDADGALVATCGIAFISGLSLRTAHRAPHTDQKRSRRQQQVRAGIGHAMFEDAAARARAAGCTLMQLTTNTARTDARRFYQDFGFVVTHDGFKWVLDD